MKKRSISHYVLFQYLASLGESEIQVFFNLLEGGMYGKQIQTLQLLRHCLKFHPDFSDRKNTRYLHPELEDYLGSLEQFMLIGCLRSACQYLHLHRGHALPGSMLEPIETAIQSISNIEDFPTAHLYYLMMQILANDKVELLLTDFKPIFLKYSDQLNREDLKELGNLGANLLVRTCALMNNPRKSQLLSSGIRHLRNLLNGTRQIDGRIKEAYHNFCDLTERLFRLKQVTERQKEKLMKFLNDKPFIGVHHKCWKSRLNVDMTCIKQGRFDSLPCSAIF